MGRVQTPTLAMVVEREDRIRKFKSRDYWELEAASVCRRRIPGRWFDEKFKRLKATSTPPPSACGTRPRRRGHPRQMRGQTGVAEDEEAKPSTQLSPLLFDLTSPQREANGPLRLLRPA